MKKVMVRYKVKAGRADENEQFIRQVFDELKEQGPDGLRYASFRQSDGLTFVHIVSIETDDDSNPLATTPAFKTFQQGLRDRCDELPVAVELEEVGAYRMLR
jgi:hypothetical protein